MEFYEKLQELRKSRGLTQEELAEALYVSRTAISKWESGKGYPSIDSLKELSKFFSVTIDDLLSSEKLLFIAEKENKSNIRSMCNLLFGIVDLCFLLLVILPLYPNTINGHIYSVNLFAYAEAATINRLVYCVLFGLMIVLGLTELILRKIAPEKNCKISMDFSIGLNILIVLLLAITREAYAIIVAFLLLIIKAVLFFVGSKTTFL